MENPNDLFANKRLQEMIFGAEEEKKEDISEQPIKEMSIPPENSESPFYMDEQVGFTSLQYLLKPDIPRKYYAEFRKFLLMIDKLTPLAYIQRDDILRYKILFRIVATYYKLGLPASARRQQAEFLFEIQLSRAVEGFERVMQATIRNVNVEEGGSVAPTPSGRRRGILGRIFGGGK